MTVDSWVIDVCGDCGQSIEVTLGGWVCAGCGRSNRDGSVRRVTVVPQPVEEPLRRPPDFIVPGDPMPMPRVRYRIVDLPGRKPFVTTYTPKTADARKAAVAATWREESTDGPVPGHVYLGLRCRFVFPRPTSHLNAAGDVAPRHAQTMPASRGASRGGRRYGGDVDNCLKLVMDALSGVAFADDQQIVAVEGLKLYVDQADPGRDPRGDGWTEVSIDAIRPTPESGTAPRRAPSAAADAAGNVDSENLPAEGAEGNAG